MSGTTFIAQVSMSLMFTAIMSGTTIIAQISMSLMFTVRTCLRLATGSFKLYGRRTDRFTMLISFRLKGNELNKSYVFLNPLIQCFQRKLKSL